MEKDPDKKGTQESQHTDKEIKEIKELKKRIHKVFQSSNWQSELLAGFEAAERTYEKNIRKYNSNPELYQKPCY